MQCPNIIIVVGSGVEKDTTKFGKEVKKGVNQLKTKYAARNLFCFEFDEKDETTNTTKIAALVKNRTNLSARTGMYLIGHGSGGMVTPITGVSGLRVFAKAVCTFAEIGFTISKICIICCTAIKRNVNWDAENKVMTVEPFPVPDKLGEENEIYVNTICRALSEADREGKLKNIMVAGYVQAVFLWDPKSSNLATKSKAFAKPGLKLLEKVNNPTEEHLMRPRPPQPPQGEKISDQETAAYQNRLKEYATNKIVYKLEGGVWTLGKLSDYTDHRDEWRNALIEQEKA